MSITRRSFVAGAAALGLRGANPPAPAKKTSSPTQRPTFDPWIEIRGDALAQNIREISRLTSDTPILAVLKNNAYGLGIEWVGRTLDPDPAVTGFAVVKTDEAIRLRDAGVTKPVLLMGMVSDAQAIELVHRHVSLSLYTDDAARRVRFLSQAAGRPIDVHLYLDTGMSRMGMPYHRAGPWLEELLAMEGATVRGTYTAFTEDSDFDPEQLQRFFTVTNGTRTTGRLGQLHAASSNGVFHLPEAHLDLVRPGIAMYGGYPSRPEEERALGTLLTVPSLKAGVVRVAQLRAGDSVSYGRNYIADGPTWIATLPVGHADGYPRAAVRGAKVLIGGNLYPVIGAVSASHTIVEIGEEKRVNVGDVATLMGPDDPAISPNALAETTGVSVYDLFMHLNPRLGRIAV